MIACLKQCVIALLDIILLKLVDYPLLVRRVLVLLLSDFNSLNPQTFATFEVSSWFCFSHLLKIPVTILRENRNTWDAFKIPTFLSSTKRAGVEVKIGNYSEIFESMIQWIAPRYVTIVWICLKNVCKRISNRIIIERSQRFNVSPLHELLFSSPWSLTCCSSVVSLRVSSIIFT